MSKSEIYPKWVYHETKGQKLVNSEEQYESLGDGWEETPAKFSKKQTSKAQKPSTVQKEAGATTTAGETTTTTKGDEVTTTTPTTPTPIQTADFANKNKPELIEFLISKGVDKKGLSKLSKDDLIAKIGELGK